MLLLHGLAAGARSMRTPERGLKNAGYETLNFACPSCRLYIVASSMGGLLARVAIARERPPDLGRVVMLAPPND